MTPFVRNQGENEDAVLRTEIRKADRTDLRIYYHDSLKQTCYMVMTIHTTEHSNSTSYHLT